MKEKQNGTIQDRESPISAENDTRSPQTLPKDEDMLRKHSDSKEDSASEDEQPVSKSRKILNTVVNVVLIAAIVLAAVCTYISFVSSSGSGVPSFFGIRVLTVQSDSMYDTLKSGDLILDVPVKDPTELRNGDIITFWTLINGEYALNTHRIVNIYTGGEHLLFETKGDNNTLADPMTVHESEIVGQYKLRVPGLGKLVDYLQTAKGFFIVVVIPVLLFFIFHLVQFFRVLFEYQNVKMLIKYEKERGRTEDLIASQVKDEKLKEEMRRAAIEAELREKLKAELMADMARQQAESATSNQNASEEKKDQ
jgi:signal peptidase